MIKEKIMKESIMTDETLNRDIEKTAKNVKSSEEEVQVSNELKKTIKSNKCSIV